MFAVVSDWTTPSGELDRHLSRTTRLSSLNCLATYRRNYSAKTTHDRIRTRTQSFPYMQRSSLTPSSLSSYTHRWSQWVSERSLGRDTNVWIWDNGHRTLLNCWCIVHAFQFLALKTTLHLFFCANFNTVSGSVSQSDMQSRSNQSINQSTNHLKDS